MIIHVIIALMFLQFNHTEPIEISFDDIAGDDKLQSFLMALQTQINEHKLPISSLKDIIKVEKVEDDPPNEPSSDKASSEKASDLIEQQETNENLAEPEQKSALTESATDDTSKDEFSKSKLSDDSLTVSLAKNSTQKDAENEFDNTMVNKLFDFLSPDKKNDEKKEKVKDVERKKTLKSKDESTSKEPEKSKDDSGKVTNDEKAVTTTEAKNDKPATEDSKDENTKATSKSKKKSKSDDKKHPTINEETERSVQNDLEARKLLELREKEDKNQDKKEKILEDDPEKCNEKKDKKSQISAEEEISSTAEKKSNGKQSESDKKKDTAIDKKPPSDDKESDDKISKETKSDKSSKETKSVDKKPEKIKSKKEKQSSDEKPATKDKEKKSKDEKPIEKVIDIGKSKEPESSSEKDTKSDKSTDKDEKKDEKSKDEQSIEKVIDIGKSKEPESSSEKDTKSTDKSTDKDEKSPEKKVNSSQSTELATKLKKLITSIKKMNEQSNAPNKILISFDPKNSQIRIKILPQAEISKEEKKLVVGGMKLVSIFERNAHILKSVYPKDNYGKIKDVLIYRSADGRILEYWGKIKFHKTKNDEYIDETGFLQGKMVDKFENIIEKGVLSETGLFVSKDLSSEQLDKSFDIMKRLVIEIAKIKNIKVSEIMDDQPYFTSLDKMIYNKTYNTPTHGPSACRYVCKCKESECKNGCEQIRCVSLDVIREIFGNTPQRS